MNNVTRYCEFSIEDLKAKDYFEVCNLYDGYSNNQDRRLHEGTLRYAIDIAENNYQQSKKSKKKKLNEFTDLLKWLSIYHEVFFFHFVNGNENETAKEFCDSCSIRIAKIQNLYIIPLTNDISLKKANISIWIGILSMIIGTGFSIYSSISSKSKEQIIDSSNLVKEKTEVSDNVLLKKTQFSK